MKSKNTVLPQLNINDFEDRSLLILDDDDPLRGRLSRAMEKKGFTVKEAKSVEEGLKIVKNTPGVEIVFWDLFCNQFKPMWGSIYSNN